MTEGFRQNFDQDQTYLTDTGPRPIADMSQSEVAKAFGEIALLPNVGNITSSLLFQALRSRSRALGNAHD